MREERGFTLVEMLIVISILAVVGALILDIFTRTLRGSNKSAIIGAIKQNGQLALETMDKTIRNSDHIICPALSPPAISAQADSLVVVKGGIYTRYRFIAPLGSTNECTLYVKNGCIVQDQPVKQIIRAREETDSQFINRVCSSADSLVNWIVLTDAQSETAVSVENGLFIREKEAGYLDQVSVKFDVRPPLGATSALAGTIDPVNFQTTIQLR